MLPYMIYFYILIIVQVVVESLPISSSTHLLLVEKLMRVHTQYDSAIDYMLHGLTAGIVALFFRADWWLLLSRWRRCYKIIAKLVFLTLIADVITAVCLYVIRMSSVAYVFQWPLWVGLCITALLLYSLRSERLMKVDCARDNCSLARNRGFDLGAALALGLAQGLAFLPGISRFGLVYVTSRWVGFDERRAFQVTWMIFWPLLVAASMQGTYRLFVSGVLYELLTGATVVVMFIATVLGYGALCFAARLAYTRKLWVLSIYVALLAILVFVLR